MQSKRPKSKSKALLAEPTVLLAWQIYTGNPDEDAETWLPLNRALQMAQELQNDNDGKGVLAWEIWWNNPEHGDKWEVYEGWNKAGEN
jgi:hypothetical protein